MKRLVATASVCLVSCQSSLPAQVPSGSVVAEDAPSIAAECPPVDAPQAAYSGKPASLPEVPVLAERPLKSGKAYTVYGALHDFRSPVLAETIQGKDLVIEGWIVRTNYADAPKCAVHPTGQADSMVCRAPIPAIWIGDDPTKPEHSIKVMGFTSNWAQLYTAILAYRSNPQRDIEDEFLGIPIPRPIPNVGAKVRIAGNYAVNYSKSTAGIESDPRNGILTYMRMEYLQEARTPAVLPGTK